MPKEKESVIEGLYQELLKKNNISELMKDNPAGYEVFKMGFEIGMEFSLSYFNNISDKLLKPQQIDKSQA